MYRSNSQLRRRYDGRQEGAEIPAAAVSPAAVSPTRAGRISRAGTGSPRGPSAWTLALSPVYAANREAGIRIAANQVTKIAGPIYQRLKEQGLTGPELARRTTEETIAAIRQIPPAQLEQFRAQQGARIRAAAAARGVTPRSRTPRVAVEQTSPAGRYQSSRSAPASPATPGGGANGQQTKYGYSWR